MRVLVVDDNRDAADLLSELIAMELGCRVSAEYDGRGALQRALAERPDVLVLDIRMPDFGGVEVVREIARRQAAAAQSPRWAPLFLAVTGNDVSTSLADIDGCFHAAFAKPVDGHALVGLLRRHWQGDGDAQRHTPWELSDLLCQIARKSVPVLRSRGQVLTFDYRGPALVLHDDPVALHSGLFRLLCAVADMAGAGFTAIDSSARREPSGDWCLIVDIAAAGALLAPAAVDEVLERLGLADDADTVTAGAPARTASGTCPSSGAHVHCRVEPANGVRLRFELGCRPQQVLDTSVDAQGAQAWIVDADGPAGEALQQRLQRLGWRVHRFDSFAGAREHAVQTSPPDGMPELVVVIDGLHADANAWAALQAVLPPRVRCIHVVAIGSAALRGRDGSPACSVHVDPLSPSELIVFTRDLKRPAHAGTQPDAALPALAQRPRLLVVDDMEVNRGVASALAAALGYDVEVVADGLDALRYCSLSPPDVVLMDLNMPVLGGFDATQRMRHLQRLGRMQPFPIVAATANNDQATADQCRLVGMDGFLSKPLALQVLAEELRRVTLNAPG